MVDELERHGVVAERDRQLEGLVHDRATRRARRPFEVGLGEEVSLARMDLGQPVLVHPRQLLRRQLLGRRRQTRLELVAQADGQVALEHRPLLPQRHQLVDHPQLCRRERVTVHISDVRTGV